MEDNFLDSLKNVFPGATTAEDSIDWTGVEAESSGFEPLKEGHYNLTISEASYEVSPKGATQIKLTYAVEGTKRKIWDTLTIKDYPGYVVKKVAPSTIGKGRLKSLLGFANIKPEDFKFSQVFALVGTKFSGKVVIDTYNPDKPKNKVSSISAYKEPTVKAEAF